MKIVLLTLMLAIATIAFGADAGSKIPGVSLSLRRSLSGPYVLVVRNDSAAAIWYSGYGAVSGSPYYSLEILKEGKWADYSLGWCGVGLGESRLDAKKEIRLDPAPEITFPISAGEKFRIAIDFSTEPYREGKKSLSARIYSNEISYIPSEKKRASQMPEPIPSGVAHR